ncbi:hypothetical protein HC174_16335 [Salinimicrobium sp. CDJ15-81-2]|nr:hypothetical protein [Salinimicrobium nanhaiense]
MKKPIAILFTLFLLTASFGQTNEESHQLCVINILGAKVYEKPTFDSKTLAHLPVGKTVVIEKAVDSQEILKIGNGFSLKGNWIKPKGINGFVFSSDLTDKKAEIGKNQFGHNFINVLGSLIEKKEEEKMVKTDQGEFPKHFEYKFYENGIYTYTSWDGCFDHVTEYKNLSLSEVYHQMVSDYGIMMNGNEFQVPMFKEKSGNTLKFEGGGATEDLQIEIKDNGTIVVSSYDCT